MPTFVIVCTDRSNSSDLRLTTRPEHVTYIEAARESILLAGPLLNDNDQIVGSIFLVEADDVAGANDFVANDPFAKAGIFESVTVKRFRKHIGTLQ